MKKLISAILVLCMITVSALACETLLPRDEGTKAPEGTETEYEVFDDCSKWAIEKDSRELCGIKYPEEKLEVKKAYTGTSMYIRGKAQGGLIRMAGVITVLDCGEEAFGLTKLDSVRFFVPQQYVGFVSEIVERRIGTELSAASIAAATLWRRGDTVSHIFWPEDAVVVPVIRVEFNYGEFETYIYAGDFDGKDGMELGFLFGVPYPTITKEPEPTATPEPEPEVTPAPTNKPQQEPTVTKAPTVTEEPKSTCAPKQQCEPKNVKVCWDFGINITVWFKGCISWFQKCCGK